MLRFVPSDGKSIGNRRLMRRFAEATNAGPAIFKTIKEGLIQDGVLARGRGMGGSVHRLERPADSSGTRESLKKAMLEDVPTNGRSIGNKSLRKLFTRKTRSTEKTFWDVRNELIEHGVLTKGRGLGGSVYRSDSDVPKLKTVGNAAGRNESDLYEPMLEALRRYWPQEMNIGPNQCVFQITALGGSKRTGGKYTRPDLTVVAMQTFKYFPNKVLHVVTFEVKPQGYRDIVGVYETAAHSAFANESYLAIHVGKKDSAEDERLDRIKAECERFGVGLVLFLNPSSWDTYTWCVEPKMQVPHPREVNQFIHTQLDRANQDSLINLK